MSDYGNHEVVDENVHPQSNGGYSPRPVVRSNRSHTRTPSPNVRRTRNSRSGSRSPNRRYRKRSPVARSRSPYNGFNGGNENPELSHNLGIHGLADHDDHEVLDEIRPFNRSYSPRPSSSRYVSRSRSPPARRIRKSRSGSRSPTRRYRQRSPVPHHRRSHYNRNGSGSGHSKANRETPEPSRCLGVFGLSMSTDENELREVFGRYGAIEMVKIIYDAQTRQSRGFGFVYFENEGDASEAKEQCDGLKLGGRQIRVDFSMTQRAHSPTPGYYMGKKSRSRFGEGDRRDGGGRGYDRGGYGRSRDDGHDDRDRKGGGFDRRRRSPSYGDRSGGDGRMRYSRSHSRSPPRQRHYR